MLLPAPAYPVDTVTLPADESGYRTWLDTLFLHGAVPNDTTVLDEKCRAKCMLTCASGISLCFGQMIQLNSAARQRELRFRSLALSLKLTLYFRLFVNIIFFLI